MNAHRVETVISQNRTLMLKDLPFRAGESVEVIILQRSSKLNEKDRYPLRGKPIEYINPTEPVDEWMEQALLYPGIRFLDLTPQIAIESTQLPARFHKDPADQIIVATARIHNCPLLTADAKILGYGHVNTLK